MSVEILLVPLALAAAKAIASVLGGNEDERMCVVQTRLKHPELLVEALSNLGATAKVRADDGVKATWDGVRFGFVHYEDGTLSAKFDTIIDVARAKEIVMAVDREYARLVQKKVYERVLERAGQLGMTVESETVDEEEGITLVLNVDDQRG